MKHIFLLIVMFNGEIKSNDMFFYSVIACTDYALQLNTSMAVGFQAYCTPVKMDPDENPDIKVY